MRYLLAWVVTCAFVAPVARALDSETTAVESAATERDSEAAPTESADDVSREEPDPDGDADRSFAQDDHAACLRDPVVVRHLRRPREVARLALTRCDGSPNLDALQELSFVARAWQTPRPTEADLAAYRAAHPERADRWATERNRWLHPGLLVRLQAIADRWPTRELVIVSGHRPTARRTSRHRFGRALDLQVDGVERAEVAAFAQSLARTGVGYYPNSTFTHVDVRDESVYWVDRSGPGERPDYGAWPPTERESEAHRGAVLAQLEDALDELHVDVPGSAPSPAPSSTPSSTPPSVAVPPAPIERASERPTERSSRRARSPDPEAERIRREAFAAIDALRGARPAEPTRTVSDVTEATRDEAVDWSVPW